MDNLTHTLFGAALGHAGLKRLTGLAMPALMIAANIPDVDVMAAPFGHGLTGRRGWTHGPIGVLVLPAVLAVCLLLFDQWQQRRGRRPSTRPPVRPAQLLLLCYIGALSHPLLDLMNTWGIRLLMPFSERWFYGDALFIIDPWIWLALGGGIWLARRGHMGTVGHRSGAAIVALTAVSFYIGAMVLGSRVAEAKAARAFQELGLGEADQVTAIPVFADPFRRGIVVQTGDCYAFGEARWLPTPQLELDPELVFNGMRDPAIGRAAGSDRQVSDFLYWSRYPLAGVTRHASATTVTLGDARFGRTPEAGLIGVRSTLPVPDGNASHPASGCGRPDRSPVGAR